MKLLTILLIAALLGSPGLTRAQDADAMSALVELLMESEDAAFQLDLLKGISAALKLSLIHI